jgi:hypothetical protein
LALLNRREPALGAAYLAPLASAACATVGQTVAPLDGSPLGALFVLRGGSALGAARSALARAWRC